MLAKAHIVTGLAAAFTVMSPSSMQEAVPVVAGAAAGCIICDIDAEGATERIDASRWRIIDVAVICIILMIDYTADLGFLRSAAIHWPYLWFAGLAGFVMTCTFASVSTHRGFSHSLIAMALETASVWLMFPSAAKPFAIAFASHIPLDILNKKPVRLLYPV